MNALETPSLNTAGAAGVLGKLRPLLLSTAIAVLSGCAVGPNYESVLPAAPGQSAFLGSDAEIYNSDAVPSDWWKLYNDSALNDIVGTALAANTDLRQAEANLRRLEALWGESRSQQLPSVNVEATETYSRQNLFFGDEPLSVQNNVYTTNLGIAYQVDLFGRIRRAIEAAQADTEAMRAALQATRLTVVANTVRSYAAACHAGRQLTVAEQHLGLQERRVEITGQLLDAGRGTSMDLAVAKAQLAQTRALLPALRSARNSALFRLAALLGETPEGVPATAVNCDSAPTLASTIPVGDGTQLLRRRPDVLQAERELAAATARVGVAEAMLYPSVSLGAAIGSSAQSAADLFSSSTETWNYGPLISWSFPQLNGTFARIRQAEASVDAAMARFESAWLEALRETETALDGYQQSLQRQAALNDASTHSSEAAQLAQLRFEAGQLNYLDVLQAELGAVAARSSLVAMDAELTALQVDLFLALGGGWGSQ